MRLLTLNIRQGGGKRAAAIAAFLVSQNCDIIVLTEFRENAPGHTIRQTLASNGWCWQKSSMPPHAKNGLLIASRQEFSLIPFTGEVPHGNWRWLEARFPDLTLIAAYFPQTFDKLEYWRWFIPQLEARVKDACIAIGDFNTGKHNIDEEGKTFVGPEYVTKLEI